MAERESSEEQRKRQDEELDEYRRSRQARLGHVEEEKPKKVAKKTPKKSESESEEE